jgi:hypothetical protein
MVIDIGLENREIKPTLAYGRIKVGWGDVW